MAKLTKRNKAIAELVSRTEQYGLKEAVELLKKGPSTKFDQTVEISLKLNLEQSSNPIRGTVSLPHGTGKTARVAVFCKGDFQKQAEEAGADHVGAEDLMKKVSEGWFDFDVAVTTPDMMKDLARLGKVLGPRGLMPNPKTGTVTTEIADAVKQLKAGKIEYRMDKQSGVRGAVGKLSFPAEHLTQNIESFVKAVLASNPKLQKIQNVKSVAISSSMGPGIKINRMHFRQA